MRRALGVVNNNKKALRRWKKKNRLLTDYAAELLEGQRKLVGDLEVIIEDNGGRCSVWESGLPGKSYRVNLTRGTYVRCAVRKHLRIPCAHILAAIGCMNKSKLDHPPLISFFDPAYTIAYYEHTFTELSCIFHRGVNSMKTAAFLCLHGIDKQVER